MLLIRPATAEDLAAAEEIAARAAAEMRHIYRPHADFVIPVRAGSVQLVAELEGSIVGTVTYAATEDRLHLRRLAVDVAFRRQGVTRAMVEHAVEVTRELNLRALSLYTIEQTGNVQIFERLGFRRIDTVSVDWAESMCGEELSEVFMEKGI